MHTFVTATGIFADTQAIRIAQEKGCAVDHLGFGNFRVVMPDGRSVEFFRRDGTIDWPGMDGRPHALMSYDQAIVRDFVALLGAE